MNSFQYKERPLKCQQNSTLEYACPVWHPYLVKHIHVIESVQRRASRLICGPDKAYAERLAEINWDCLELRRKYLSIVQMYKIIFGYCDVDCSKYYDAVGPSRTRSNRNYKIRPKAAYTKYFKYSFFNRYINDWNSLSSSGLSPTSINSFKTSLLNHLCSQFFFSSVNVITGLLIFCFVF